MTRSVHSLPDVACFVCRVPITSPMLEWHHFPVPKRHDGTAVIPLCRPCHDMIDRIPLDEWPMEWAVEGWAALWAALPRPGRLLLLKLTSMITDALRRDTEPPDGDDA